MNKYTPGNWKEVPLNRTTSKVVSGDTHIATFFAKAVGCPPDFIGYPPKGEQMANMALFLAARDLLESLKAVLAESDRKTVAYERAHAAIAKAEGGIKKENGQ